MLHIDNYQKVVGDDVLYNLYKKARRLAGKKIVNINSTHHGGGVAEILDSMVNLMNDVGIQYGWRIITGPDDFFFTTKKFHNGLQGEQIHLTEQQKEMYLNVNERFSIYSHLDHDAVIIHDPQPLPLVKHYRKAQPWIWRCHIDLSNPDPELWSFLKPNILRYEVVIVSHEDYKKKDLPVDQRIIRPAIDPLSPKNMEISDQVIKTYLKKFKIKTDKPIVTQISRFDKWKDPLGVVETFKKVKSQVDCRLILCGNMATDDPEGMIIYDEVKKQVKDLVKSGDVMLITVSDQILVNVLQRISDVILQKSLKEGFGLTVSEALWKGTPVVAGNVGGIPTQIENGKSGFLVDPTDYDECASRIVEILKKPDLAEKLGKNGRETVRKKYLTTRLMLDYMDLLLELL